MSCTQKNIKIDISKCCDILNGLTEEISKNLKGNNLWCAWEHDFFMLVKCRIKDMRKDDIPEKTLDIAYPSTEHDRIVDFDKYFRLNMILTDRTPEGVDFTACLFREALGHQKYLDRELHDSYAGGIRGTRLYWVRDFIMAYNLLCMLQNYKYMMWEYISKTKNNFDINKYTITEEVCEKFAIDFRREYMLQSLHTTE